MSLPLRKKYFDFLPAIQDYHDVDILVEFEPDARMTLFQFTKLQRELKQLLHCRVDLATRDSLHKELRDDILKEAVLAA